MLDDQMKLHLSHSCRSLLEVITVFWRAQNGVFCTQSPSEPHAHSVAHTRRSSISVSAAGQWVLITGCSGYRG
jgi:hypothetical protein